MPQDYYFYLASNWQSAGNVHVEMDNYEKIYDLNAEYELPERIFLDKGSSYRFSIFLTVRGHSFKSQPELGLWAGPEWRPSGGAGGWNQGTTRGAELLSGLVRGPTPHSTPTSIPHALSRQQLPAAKPGGPGRGSGRPQLH